MKNDFRRRICDRPSKAPTSEALLRWLEGEAAGPHERWS
jgi:hypothetical protein